jgi:aspartate racemase
MHIGLIGGIGPAATITYYTRLVEAFKTANLPLKLTITHADVSTLAANATDHNSQAQAHLFAQHLAQLQRAGCDIALITTLTGHFCFDETRALSELPLISGVEIIDRYCAKQNIKVLGLLGSPPVLTTHLFGLLQTPRTVVPQHNLVGLGQAYMQVATSGECSTAQSNMFIKAGADMMTDQGAEAVLLAGTDLALAFGGQSPGYTVIDAVDLHVAALLELAGKSP